MARSFPYNRVCTIHSHVKWLWIFITQCHCVMLYPNIRDGSCAHIVMKSWMNKFLEYWHLICIEHVHVLVVDLGAWAQPMQCAVFDGKSRPVLIVIDCAKMMGRHSAALHKYLSQAFSPRKLLNLINLIKIYDFIFNTWFHVIVHMIVYTVQ